MVWTCNAKIKYRKDKGDNQLEPNDGRRPRGRLKKRWEECIQDRKARRDFVLAAKVLYKEP